MAHQGPRAGTQRSRRHCPKLPVSSHQCARLCHHPPGFLGARPASCRLPAHVDQPCSGSCPRGPRLSSTSQGSDRILGSSLGECSAPAAPRNPAAGLGAGVDRAWESGAGAPAARPGVPPPPPLTSLLPKLRSWSCPALRPASAGRLRNCRAGETISWRSVLHSVMLDFVSPVSGVGRAGVYTDAPVSGNPAARHGDHRQAFFHLVAAY